MVADCTADLISDNPQAQALHRAAFVSEHRFLRARVCACVRLTQRCQGVVHQAELHLPEPGLRFLLLAKGWAQGAAICTRNNHVYVVVERKLIHTFSLKMGEHAHVGCCAHGTYILVSYDIKTMVQDHCDDATTGLRRQPCVYAGCAGQQREARARPWPNSSSAVSGNRGRLPGGGAPVV